MVMVTPAALVAPPATIPLPFGLFSALSWRNDRFEQGVKWESVGGCEPIEGISAAQDTGMTGLPKDLGSHTESPLEDALPFTVYGEWKGSPVAFTPERAQALAAARLAKWEEARVEQALWTGDLLNVPNLTGANGQTTAPTVVTAAAGVAAAVAALEGFIASDLNTLGVIHMTREMAVLARAADVVFAERGVLRTVLGTQVVAGAGYPGTSPAGTGTASMYATGQLMGYRSDVFTSSNRRGDLLDRSRNDLYAVAERTFLVGFDTCAIGTVAVS